MNLPVVQTPPIHDILSRLFLLSGPNKTMSMFRTCLVPLVTIIISTSSQTSPIIIRLHGIAFAIMPKHALDSHLESPKAKKKKRVSDGSAKDSGAMDTEKTGRSVQEKLLAGIAIGFTKAQNQQQAAQKSQSFYEVVTLQDSLDKEFHVNPRILQTLNSPLQSHKVLIPAEEEKKEEYQRPHPSGRSNIILDHFCRRIDQR